VLNSPYVIRKNRCKRLLTTHILRKCWHTQHTNFRDLGHLPKWTFDQKRISANSNPKAQKPYRENDMTFLGKCPITQFPTCNTKVRIQCIVEIENNKIIVFSSVFFSWTWLDCCWYVLPYRSTAFFARLLLKLCRILIPDALLSDKNRRTSVRIKPRALVS